MKEEQKAYRNIFKATALFGGVQAYNILLTLIRTKIVAVLLGTAGIGILGLFNNTINIISTLTRLGIDQGAIKDISISANSNKLPQTTTVVKKWSIFTGLSGAVITFFLAPLLSQWSFGDKSYTTAFYWLSCTLLLDTLSKGQLAIFQGLHKLKILVKANLSGATVSLILSIPIYYLWGKEGIVPAIIITYICTFIFTTYYYRKENIPSDSLSLKEIYHQGKGIVNLGIMLTISGFIVTLGSYLFNIYLSQHGGIKDVGLYQAGFNLIEKYIGVIFMAMAADYYPRLAAVNQDNQEINKMINQQGIANLLILCPIICIFIPTAPLIVRILLSKEFLPIIPFLSWAIIGIIFKVISNIFGYTLIVKNCTKAFLLFEITSCVITLCSNIIGYTLWSIEGIGIAFLFSYICFFFPIYLFTKYKFNFQINQEFKKIIFITLGLSTLCILNIYFVMPSYKILGYILSFILCSTAASYSILKLKKIVSYK